MLRSHVASVQVLLQYLLQKQQVLTELHGYAHLETSSLTDDGLANHFYEAKFIVAACGKEDFFQLYQHSTIC